MTVFEYKAVDSWNSSLQGSITADTPRQARDQLRSQGLVVRELVERASKRDSTRWSIGRPSRYRSRVGTTIRELATLLGAGIPLLEAIDTILKQHKGGYRTCLLLVRDRVAAGAGLAEAMSEQPEVFDALAIHMVQVGENSGNLDQVLTQLAEFKERWFELRDRVVNALLYPSIVLLVSVIVTVFLMTVVVPMLLTNLLEAGRTLPWPTRILKFMSDTLLRHGWWLGIVAAAILATIVWGLRTKRGRRLWCRLLFAAPIIGPMARKQAIARISLVIATLLQSGIVFLNALEIAGRSTKNVLLREAFQQVGREVGAGREIGPSLEQTGVFPPLVVQIFAVGQQTGHLEEMLQRLATDYDRQVAVLSGRLASTLEPVLIVFLAVVVGFILFATVLPILEAGNVL